MIAPRFACCCPAFDFVERLKKFPAIIKTFDMLDFFFGDLETANFIASLRLIGDGLLTGCYRVFR